MKITILATLAVLSISIHAAEKTETVQPDPFDLSKNAKSIRELGIPTLSKVQALEQKATDLYKSQNWKAAAEANAEFAKGANWLANIISSGLKPYYGASYDDKKNFRSDLSSLVALERQSNELRRKRNRAFVIQAECLINAGDRTGGFGLLLHALELIDINDKEYWSKARNMLYEMVEVEN